MVLAAKKKVSMQTVGFILLREAVSIFTGPRGTSGGREAVICTAPFSILMTLMRSQERLYDFPFVKVHQNAPVS